MEEEIVFTALDNLRKHTQIEGIYVANPEKGLDGEVDFLFQKGKEMFVVEVKREIRNHQLPMIQDLARDHKNLMVIAETIFPKIKEEFRKQNIFYLDTAGNIFLNTNKFHLWIDGHKNQKITNEKTNRVFQVAGLKVIYQFLINDTMLNQSQRTIAKEAGVALGNISRILNDLKEMKFLIKKSKKELQLINKKVLLQNWIERYDEKMKPTLHIGNFRFVRTDDERNWKQLKLKQYQTCWGGEPAGEMFTNYLQPEIFTIYTDETRDELIKNYHIVPEKNGNIKVYKKFWNDYNGFNEMVVHPILAYADLLNTGNSRCVETAKMIYDSQIKQII